MRDFSDWTVTGMTPLWLACRGGHSSTALLLLQLGADPAILTTARNGEDTALWVAAFNNLKSVVTEMSSLPGASQLIKMGEDPREDSRINQEMRDLVKSLFGN